MSSAAPETEGYDHNELAISLTSSASLITSGSMAETHQLGWELLEDAALRVLST